MTRPDNTVFRIITFIFCGVLALRYAFWRTTETLPVSPNRSTSFPGLLLYIAEMYCLLMLAISFFMLSDPIKRVAPKGPVSRRASTVDVFIPTYNEDPEFSPPRWLPPNR
jgi:cellulose synthase (UDP-forming)